VADVLYFQSDEKYTRVVTADGEALIKTPIREITEGLDPDAFWQIHRSTVVNVHAIAAVTRDFRGQAHVKMKGRDESLVVSRIYSHLFKQM
jgi:DNA-binding LytR/AlgR family response regulator